MINREKIDGLPLFSLCYMFSVMIECIIYVCLLGMVVWVHV